MLKRWDSGRPGSEFDSPPWADSYSLCAHTEKMERTQIKRPGLGPGSEGLGRCLHWPQPVADAVVAYHDHEWLDRHRPRPARI